MPSKIAVLKIAGAHCFSLAILLLNLMRIETRLILYVIEQEDIKG